jgi:hypothetical protein
MAYTWDVWKPSGEKSKHFGGFSTVDDFLNHYASCDPRCHYEICRDETLIAVAFDLEVMYGDALHAATIAAMGLTPSDPDGPMRISTEHIERVFPQLVGARRLVSTSHRGRSAPPGAAVDTTQHSDHIKYPDFVLKDMNARHAFKSALGECLHHLLPCLDVSVYDSNKQMRLLYSCKIDQVTPTLCSH